MNNLSVSSILKSKDDGITIIANQECYWEFVYVADIGPRTITITQPFVSFTSSKFWFISGSPPTDCIEIARVCFSIDGKKWIIAWQDMSYHAEFIKQRDDFIDEKCKNISKKPSKK